MGQQGHPISGRLWKLGREAPPGQTKATAALMYSPVQIPPKVTFEVDGEPCQKQCISPQVL